MEKHLKEIAKELKLIRRELEKSNKTHAISVEPEQPEDRLSFLAKQISKDIEESKRKSMSY